MAGESCSTLRCNPANNPVIKKEKVKKKKKKKKKMDSGCVVKNSSPTKWETNEVLYNCHVVIP